MALSLPMGWYAVVDSAGNLAIVQHTTSGPITLGNGNTATDYKLLSSDTSQSMQTLLDNLNVEKVLNQFAGLWTNQKQQNSLVAQISEGGKALEGDAKELIIAPSGKTATPTSGGGTTDSTISGSAEGGSAASTIAGAAGSAANSAASGITGIASSIEGFTLKVLIRGAELIGGSLLVLFGLKTLTGSSIPTPGF